MYLVTRDIWYRQDSVATIRIENNRTLISINDYLLAHESKLAMHIDIRTNLVEHQLGSEVLGHDFNT